MPRAQGRARAAHPWGLGRSIHAAHGLVSDFSPLTGFSDLDLCAAI
jgi:hypothetical protein